MAKVKLREEFCMAHYSIRSAIRQKRNQEEAKQKPVAVQLSPQLFLDGCIQGCPWWWLLFRGLAARVFPGSGFNADGLSFGDE